MYSAHRICRAERILHQLHLGVDLRSTMAKAMRRLRTSLLGQMAAQGSPLLCQPIFMWRLVVVSLASLNLLAFGLQVFFLKDLVHLDCESLLLTGQIQLVLGHLRVLTCFLTSACLALQDLINSRCRWIPWNVMLARTRRSWLKPYRFLANHVQTKLSVRTFGNIAFPHKPGLNQIFWACHAKLGYRRETFANRTLVVMCQPEGQALHTILLTICIQRPTMSSRNPS